MKISAQSIVVAGGFALALAVPAPAQDEDALRRAFEGRSVVARVDMPATSKGVDIHADQEQPLDFEQHASRIRDNGVAVHEGQRMVVTKVKVKDDLIEFHLGGGGFGLFDGTGSASYTRAAKTEREKDLERKVKDETDRERKRRLERELDDERKDREREDERNKIRVDEENERRREHDRQRALEMGSRFNLRYEKRVPVASLTPDGFMRAMSRYVEFPGSGIRAPERPEDVRLERDTPPPSVRKGMTMDEVKELLGPPEHVTQRRSGDLDTTVAVFRSGSDRIEVTFVSGVVVKYGSLDR